MQLLQLRILRLGFFQDGDVGVGVFPESGDLLITGPAEEFANPTLRIHPKNPVLKLNDNVPFRTI